MDLPNQESSVAPLESLRDATVSSLLSCKNEGGARRIHTRVRMRTALAPRCIIRMYVHLSSSSFAGWVDHGLNLFLPLFSR